MKTQNTTTSAGNATAAQVIRLPRLFIDDHIERDCDTPAIIKENSRFYWMRADDRHMGELLSDAAHYASETMCGAGGWDDDVMRYARSAQRLIAAYERQTGTVIDEYGRVRMVIK
jgi:hypothetical protein